MKNLKYIISIIVLLLSFQNSMAQIIIDSNNSTGELQLEKRMASTDDVVEIGEYFYYEIGFLDTNAANTSLEITDVIPTGLEYVSYEALLGTFIKVSGATPNNFDPILSPVTITGQTITFTNLDNYTKGIFRIRVRFPDTACSGEVVTNNVCAVYTNNTTGTIENVCTTSGLTSTSEGTDPWAVVSKEPLYPAIFDSNDNWYIDINNPIVKYKITIEKNPSYVNRTTGMLALDNITLQDVLLPGGIITGISPNTGYTQSGNDLIISGSWSGNTPYFSKVFILDVDYSVATTPLVVGQTITNTANLLGKTCNDVAPVNKGSASASVIVTDALPAVLDSVYLHKAVFMENRVIGCLGRYSFTFRNNNNRPITNAQIIDNLPDDITPFGPINVSYSINSASTNTSFDIQFNNNPVVTTPNAAQLTGANPTGNNLSINASTGTVLYPNDFVTVDFAFTLNSTPNTLAGGIVTNCVNATGDIIDTNTGLTTPLVDSYCASFTVENPRPKICFDKQVRLLQPGNTGGWTNAIIDAKPGDELEFRIRIVNYGSSPFTNGSLTDLLDSKYIYQGITSLPSGVIDNSVGQNLDWSNINIGANCSVAAYGGCSTSFPYVDISFKVKIAPYTPAGQINNTATINGNIPNPISDVANVRVVNSFVIQITKEISGYGLVWTDHLVETPGYTGTIQYRLKVENIGNMPITNHEIYDELPGNNDVYFPTTNPRNSDFSLENISLMTSPNYTASLLNNTLGRVRSCGDTATPSSNGNQTIKYVSNSTLNPVDVFIMHYSGTLPVVSPASGEKAVNSAYFLDCTGNTNIITPSNLATLEIYQPPCYTCPEGSEFNGYSVSNTIVNLPETGVHSELDGIPVYNENIQLQTNWQWVTGVRIYVSEFTPIYEEGCESCHFNMDQVGNLVDSMFPQQLGQLNKVATTYHGANQEFVREIIYKGLPDSSFRNGLSTNIAISLPDMLNPDCCVVGYTGCIKYVFEGPNCENCEIEYCFNLPEGPIIPTVTVCPDPEVEIVELGKPNSDCCQKVLVPHIRPCKIGAEYKWYGPQGHIVQQGTTTANSDGRLIATENGIYTLKVRCNCPDGTMTQEITTTHTVSGLIGTAPTTAGIVSHNMQRFRNGNNYSATLDIGIDPAYFQYGFEIIVQQSYTKAFSNTIEWQNINTAFYNKERCQESGTKFTLNFPYSRPGLQEQIGPQSSGGWINFFETWGNQFRIQIRWMGCDGVFGNPIVFPITNISILNVLYNPILNPRIIPRN